MSSSAACSRIFHDYRGTVPLSNRPILSRYSVSRPDPFMARASSSRNLPPPQPRRMPIARGATRRVAAQGDDSMLRAEACLTRSVFSRSSTSDSSGEVEKVEMLQEPTTLRIPIKRDWIGRQRRRRRRSINTCFGQIADFWTSLGEAEENGSFLELKNGTYFMGEEGKGSSLFVRDCCEF